MVQDYRDLSQGEVQFKRDLKARNLGTIEVEKSRLKQQSRLTMVRATEASDKLFYLRVTGRRKNFIQQLHTNEGFAYTHGDKAEAIYQHFSKQFGEQPSRSHTLDWEAIGLQSHNLEHLEESFTEERGPVSSEGHRG